MLSLLGFFYPDYSYRTMYSSLIVVYIFTTGISGYVSEKFYKQLGGQKWVANILITNFLFVGPLFLVWAILNTIAISYDSTAAFPFLTILTILAIYILISFPLALFGAITAKNFTTEYIPPCKVNNYKREIPATTFIKGGISQFFISGFLPFRYIIFKILCNICRTLLCIHITLGKYNVHTLSNFDIGIFNIDNGNMLYNCCYDLFTNFTRRLQLVVEIYYMWRFN